MLQALVNYFILVFQGIPGPTQSTASHRAPNRNLVLDGYLAVDKGPGQNLFKGMGLQTLFITGPFLKRDSGKRRYESPGVSLRFQIEDRDFLSVSFEFLLETALTHLIWAVSLEP